MNKWFVTTMDDLLVSWKRFLMFETNGRSTK